MNDFFERLEKILESQHKTRADLSRAIGVTQASIQGWKNGSYPSANLIVKMSEYLGVSCDYLLTGKNDGLMFSGNEPMFTMSQVEDALRQAFNNLFQKSE